MFQYRFGIAGNGRATVEVGRDHGRVGAQGDVKGRSHSCAHLFGSPASAGNADARIPAHSNSNQPTQISGASVTASSRAAASIGQP